MLKDLFKKSSNQSIKKPKKSANIPDGLFQKCPKCNETLYTDDIVENYYSCPNCDYYHRINPRERITMILDSDTFIEFNVELESGDPIGFPDYKEKLHRIKSATNLDEAVITGTGQIYGKEVAIGVMASNFLMGSMGQVVGEKLTRLIEEASKKSLPLIIFACSGGARMQEGIVSLMQMAKTSGALKKYDQAGLLYISVLTDPTTGGVMASFAMLGDIILAEPGALIGFAGPRVIEQTIGQKLPEGFQRSEYLLEHGFVDKIVKRNKLKRTLYGLIRSSEPVLVDN